MGVPTANNADSRRLLRVAGGSARPWSTAEVLLAVCDLDLTELERVEPPRGFRRDC